LTAYKTATQEIEHLLTLHPKGFDLSLTRITQLLERLNNPHQNLPPTIHIAGTNGKGSASAFCRALLESANHSVHVHTSPHLVRWHERYRLGQKLGQKTGGKLVEDAVFADALRRVAHANAGQPITVFEILTAVGFILFSEHTADACILEVGLGGRFDATNVIEKPTVSLIMPISLDHEAYLGDRVELIAAEKAGIIKRGCRVVIGHQSAQAAREVLIQTATRLRCPTFIYGQDFHAREEYGRMIYEDEDGLLDLPLPNLFGRHQLANAAAAIRAVKEAGFSQTPHTVERAMLNVAWPARMQRLTHGKLVEFAPHNAEIWLDGGHNPGAGAVIAEALAQREEQDPRPLFLITGMINTKDAVGYFLNFQDMASHVFTTPVPSTDAGVAPHNLAQMACQAGLSSEPTASVAAALQNISKSWDASQKARILISGSLYLAGHVLSENGTEPA
jgi:dihydrofolate synthase / folylpolyglutamate synthase